MQYPGNPALSPEIQRRIVTTFSQTLELAARGNRQEAMLGCDFILRMDPAFVPARLLHERVAKTIEGTSVVVGDLELNAAPSEAPAAPAQPVAPAPGAPPAIPMADKDILAAALLDLLDKRELRRLVQVAEENRQEVAGNPAIRRLVETAYGRLEAEPYVQGFVDAARQALERGDLLESGRLLEKARQLDGTHPGIAEIETLKQTFRSVPASPAPSSWAVSGDDTRPGGIAELPTSEGLRGVFEAPELPTWGMQDPVSPLGAGVDLFGGGSAHAGRGGDGRVGELLTEGQTLADRGDFQGAIDAWSRIFLIDIDHEEAARRIDEARRLKAESERRVEEVFHEAVAAYEVGDLERARAGFGQVLAVTPGHLASRDYLDQLDRDAAGDLPQGLGPMEGPIAAARGGAAADEAMVPPSAASRPASKPDVRRSSSGPVAGKRSGGRFLAIGGLVLLVVLGIVAFAWFERDRLFPNREAPEASATASGARDPIARAKSLHDKGDLTAAVRALEKLPADDPHHAEAQALLAAWQAPKAESAAGAAVDSEAAARLERELTRAREAFKNTEYLLADSYFGRAAKLAPLATADAEQAAEAKRQLEPLAALLASYQREEWGSILPRLWALNRANPGNRDVKRLITNSYYNLAVRALQGGDTTMAVQHLTEALGVSPGSEVLARYKQFAETYTRRPKDLLYRIYVNHLPTL